MEPGTLVEVDYCDFKSESYLVMADSVSGFIQTYRTSGKTCKEAIRCIREWGSNFGKPYILKTDFDPSYTPAATIVNLRGWWSVRSNR